MKGRLRLKSAVSILEANVGSEERRSATTRAVLAGLSGGGRRRRSTQ